MKRLKEDLLTVKKHDPAARTNLEIILTYSGVHAIWAHRVSHFLYRHHCYLFAKINSQLARFFTGVEIHPGAEIGRRVFIDHGMGVVIGQTAVVEEDVVLFHGVTLGGTGKDQGKRHPTIKAGAMISAHAQILGPIVVGEGAKIGAAAVVLQSVPANATAVGIPAKIVRVDGVKIKEEKNDSTV